MSSRLRAIPVAVPAPLFVRTMIAPGSGRTRRTSWSPSRSLRLITFLVTAFCATFFETTHVACGHLHVGTGVNESDMSGPSSRVERISSMRFMSARERGEKERLTQRGENGPCGDDAARFYGHFLWCFANEIRALESAFSSSVDRFVSYCSLYIRNFHPSTLLSYTLVVHSIYTEGGEFDEPCGHSQGVYNHPD